MKSLLAYVALACSLALTPVSSTFFTGKDGKGHIGSVHGVENWKALVEGGLAVPPKEARVGKRAEETSSVESTAESSTITSSISETSTPATITDDTTTSSTSETPTAVTTTATGPSPWVSLDPDGSPVKVTPIPTTDAQGRTSTMDLAPTNTPLVDTDKDSNTHQVHIQCSESDYQDGGKWEPFCLPHNGSEWRVDEKGGDGFYYVTWNPAVFERNETLFLSLNYANHTDDKEAAGIWTDKAVPAHVGWTTVSPKSDWLEDAPNKDTVEVYFLLKGSRSDKFYTGPTLTVTTKPKPPPVDTSPNNRPPVNPLGLAIGLPLVIVFIIVMLLGTHFCMKERRKVGPIHIGGVRGRKEYGTRMSRRQRMKGGAVPLSSGEGYSDDRDDNENLPPSVPTNTTGTGWELTDVQGGRARGFDDDAQEFHHDHRRL